MDAAEKLPEPASAPAPAQPERGGTLTVDLDAVAANWRSLVSRVVTAECAAVVKSDAYGLGLEQISAKLAAVGCKTFFVADIPEAKRVRASASEATIYVLDGVPPDGAAAFAEINARPVINSMTELAEWDAFVAASNWQGGAAVHVDTGMNRLGISAAEAAALAPRVQTVNHGITLLMSHLACAETPDHPLNFNQGRLFRELRTLYHGVPASLANSSGIFLGDSTHHDVVRPGAALYGIAPTPGRHNPMRATVELTARILQVRSVEHGTSVGYGATWTAKRASRLAVVALGYADGLLRAAGGSDRARGAGAIINGKACPVAGRISMDLVCLDITDLPEGGVRRGDPATFIGGKITVDDLATSAGTIAYELLTSLGRSCQRSYRGA